MKSLSELQAMRDEMKSQVGARREGECRMRIVVGMATCGIAAGARPVLAACTEEVAKRHLTDVVVSQTGCIGICQFEPVVEIYDADGHKTTYVHVTPEKVPKIIAQHVVNGNPVVEYTIGANK
ncbi:MAG: (2Fe-2S) ferredoxin domain-containing protein [Clostridia bacterium]|nr:(2Fe-2S) ferredoxin domain-containing protein [Clostridia bacterium]